MTQTQDVLPNVPNQEEDISNLERVWRRGRGLFGWLSVTTHQAIGMRYIVTAFVMLLAGGIEALLMRIQLAKPNNTFLGPDLTTRFSRRMARP